MDSFTQHMIEKAEQRNRALGLKNVTTPRPVAEKPILSSPKRLQENPPSITKSSNTSVNKLQVYERSTPLEISSSSGVSSNQSASASKVLRQFSAYDKENMDLGIEINVISKGDVDVHVEVEEQDLSDNDEGAATMALPHTGGIVNQALAKTRNQLQRLGALYSNTDDLSSPIHRTEGQFHADTVDDVSIAGARKPKQRFGKLAALASTINEWEDDTSLHVKDRNAAVPPKPDLPSRRQAPQPPPQASTKERSISTTSTNEGNSEAEIKTTKTKKLNWDPKVIDSLEAQGFQRRESSTVKFAYDYAKDNRELMPKAAETNVVDAEVAHGKTTVVSKIVGHLDSKQKTEKSEPKTAAVTEKSAANVPVRTGLVSGRAAVFEQKACTSLQSQRPQKDPTELSLKERMQLFERNKGEALLPKAALGMAPSINQIRQDSVNKKEDPKVLPATSTSNIAGVSATATVKPTVDNKVRNKVAALIANNTTISENKIRADIQRQREEDMQVLANRFHKPIEAFGNDSEKETNQNSAGKFAPQQTKVQRTGMPPPPPPPPPPTASTSGKWQNSPNCTKRRSPGDAIEDDEKKRARTYQTATNSKRTSTNNQLYPTLSDFDSNGSESDNCNGGGTTATVSPINIHQQQEQQRRLLAESNDYEDDEDNDSYMAESELMAHDGDDDDSSADIYNGSLGRDVMNIVQNNDKQQTQQHQKQKQKKGVHYADKHFYIESRGGDSSVNTSDGSMCVDDCLDEALDADFNSIQSDDFDESDAGNSSRASRGSKGTAASNSFSFRKTPYKFKSCRPISEEQDDENTDDYHTPISIRHTTQPPVTSNLTVDQSDENMMTLVHTVSFYRRQQNANSANNTPVRKICREQQISETSSGTSSNAGINAHYHYESHFDDRDNVNQQQSHASDNTATSSQDTEEGNNEYLAREKMKKLLEEVQKQMQIIAQTSQALNLCAATVEFSGSTESVEGERHLLVATHRRQACLDEIQRLSVEKSLRPLGAPKERGRLTIKEITVPLRHDYIKKLSKDTISGHHLVCLLKYNEHVLATRTVPTLPGLLAVKFPDVLQLNNVYADFKVTVEIYGMTAQREVLPHEVKYHINLNKKSGIKTPKKKGSENILVMPPVQSPAGPNVVRTPALVHYGQAIFSLREIQRTTWQLQQLLNVSPLEGVLHMKVQCELSVSVEYKGFLTMYEDISGFGAWHRRWCNLKGSVLNYWKYPDDERKKTPMGSIDLYSCISPKVALAPRDICARLHTILLECTRPAKDTDTESLIIVPNGAETIVRYLLSADTKEEREEWCAVLNKALPLLRAWGPPH